MATTNTALYNKQVVAGGSPPNPGPMEYNHKLRRIVIETTVAALGATGDILRLCKLPAGAKVLPGLSKFTCESPGTTVTIKIGDASNDARYMASKACGGAAQDLLWSSSPGTDAYVNSAIVGGATPDQETLLLTSITIGTPTTTAKVKIEIVFALE